MSRRLPVWYVTVQARYEVHAANRADAELAARCLVARSAWDGVCVVDVDGGEPVKPIAAPVGLERWKIAFEAHEIGDLYLTSKRLDAGDRVWWTNGYVCLLAESGLEAEKSDRSALLDPSLESARDASPITFATEATHCGEIDREIRYCADGHTAIQEPFLRLVEDTIPEVQWREGAEIGEFFAFEGDKLVAIVMPYRRRRPGAA